VRRQVEGWSKRYRRPDADALILKGSWLAGREDASGHGPPTLVHNDYRLDNLVIEPQEPFRIIGVLDWEMAPLAIRSWIWAIPWPTGWKKMIRRRPPATEHAHHVEGAPTREETGPTYGEKPGGHLALRFILLFRCFSSGRNRQQIYYRYYHGQTKDERLPP